jgi:hypothetical protein
VFDHRRAKFTLEGAHEKVACAKCHTRIVEGVASFTRYTGLPYQECAPCHADPHQGSFSASCRSCHAAANWKPVAISSGFNHSNTAYPLLGKHETVVCRNCHHGSNFRLPVAHARCLDCHVKDPHNGQFRERKDGGDCSACHNVAAFVPSTFTAAAHNETRYPLEGKHSTAPCAKCHAPRGPDTVYHLGETQCSSCHADVHAGQFSREGGGTRCEDCHGLRGFRPSSFTLERHAETRFPLTGGHAAVSCGDCHQGSGGGGVVAAAKYRFRDRSCRACHADPHRGQFDHQAASGPGERSISGCETCHAVDRWRHLPGFDHSTTSFRLEGVHRAAACSSCHKAADGRPGIAEVVFTSAPRRCSACHEDPHRGQFTAAGGSEDCQRCHGYMRWKPAIFDHDRGSSFKLTGAHRNVRCVLCHPAQAGGTGKLVFRYRSTPRECAGCHGTIAADR